MKLLNDYTLTDVFEVPYIQIPKGHCPNRSETKLICIFNVHNISAFM